MGLPIKINNQYGFANMELELNGGKGSGNFGHQGRPGEVGGSAPEGTPSTSEQSRKSGEGYGSRFSKAHISEGDVLASNLYGVDWDDNGKVTVESRLDESTLKDAMKAAATMSQIGEEVYKGKFEGLGKFNDNLTAECAYAQKILADTISFVAQEAMYAATAVNETHLKQAKKSMAERLEETKKAMDTYTQGRKQLGDKVYEKADESQTKLLKDNDKDLYRAYDKLTKIYEQVQNLDDTSSRDMKIDISDIAKRR